MLVQFVCEWCGKKQWRQAGHINRSRKKGMPLFCDKKCFGLHRRNPHPLTKSEKVKAKSDYDREYRKKNKALLQKKHRDYHKKTYDPVKAAKYRKERMPLHVEYCRRPEYKKKKKKYDRKKRVEAFGEFGESFKLLQKLVKEIEKQMPNRFERYAQSQRFQWNPQTQQRRRKQNVSIQNRESGVDRL